MDESIVEKVGGDGIERGSIADRRKEEDILLLRCGIVVLLTSTNK